MPKVQSYSTSWLGQDAPGHQLFKADDTDRGRTYAYNASTDELPGPRRTIATLGTQAFVANGRDIRWGDLAFLKDKWERSPRARSGLKREASLASVIESVEQEPGAGVRTLKTRCAEDIRQLVVSPGGAYLAILTTHTVHICIIPDPSHLTCGETSPLKPQIHTLGPTTHVTSRAPIMSALWHPLGINGSCLVTVTADAIVRVWELQLDSRWSFDKPTMSIDLRKLADGTTMDQDFSASTTVTNNGFSPDTFDMEVAAASFPHRDSGGWNPMTLWVAMRGGDVYALCPLLPEKWSPPPMLIPSLSVSIVQTVASIQDNPEVSEYENLLAQQQFDWMGELDAQEPTIVEDQLGEPIHEIYNRPSRPSLVPRLQGPFEPLSEPEAAQDFEITDIMVIGKNVDAEDLMMGEEEDLEFDDNDKEGASLTVICLLSADGQTRIYLDLEGVQAEWLPPKNKPRLGRLIARLDQPTLLTYQAIDTMSSSEIDNLSDDSWPVFSPDASHRYSFWVTTTTGISFISLLPWITRLESELAGSLDAGTDFRMNLVVHTASTRDKIYSCPKSQDVILAAATSIFDADLGYLLLSATPYEPIAMAFDTPESSRPLAIEDVPIKREEDDQPLLDFYEPRPVFNTPHAFSEDSLLPQYLDNLRTSRHKTTITQDVKLSPMTLNVFTEVHKLLSDETARLRDAAAAVFIRCQSLTGELREQIRKAGEVQRRIDGMLGDGEEQSDRVRYDRRIEQANSRQEALKARIEKLKQTVGRSTTRELSVKERVWADEVRSAEKNVCLPGEDDDEDTVAANDSPNQPKKLWQRFEDLKELQDSLTMQLETLNVGKDGEEKREQEQLRVPDNIRKSKMQQVQGALARETALVEAVRLRLEKLQTDAGV
ncbi:uncharacterized protein F5Z01DRAFT_738981 [Emericellopsis atlantica]|uniref:Nuclear pore complex protein An-Nup82 n=1 Tax=Emericellopsis atlantica TaxID=2614577 RepID=A0A9P8CLY5_9HYPO|nr:uncharacterized protein F5Z01DRAFT_738981 [Emericellopsis atlantica]KAG9251520.1 hypothetical protein F5Z01DRAFT_738981 [Emericellopsis atlantica]